MSDDTQDYARDPSEMTWWERSRAQTHWRYRVKHMSRDERRERAQTLWRFRQELAEGRRNYKGGAVIKGEVNGRQFAIRMCPPPDWPIVSGRGKKRPSRRAPGERES